MVDTVKNETPQFPTLWDNAKRRNPNGTVATIVELLSQMNPILEDMVWAEGNLPTGNRTTVRTGLPESTWRRAYKGVQPTKSTTAQVDDATGTLEAYSEVDVLVADLYADKKAFLATEATAHLESMNQEIAETLIYGNATAEPSKFTGIAARYNELPGDYSSPSSQNVFDAGGTTGELTSIYLVGWGKNSIHGIYPKDSMAGVRHEYLGIDVVYDDDKGRYKAHRDHFRWDAGLTVRDWRYAARIANISLNDLEKITGTQALSVPTSIIRLMSRAIDTLPSLNNVRPVFYVSRKLHSLLMIKAMEKTVNVLAIQEGLDQFGNRRQGLSFLGVPIKKVDAIVNTEEVVTAPTA